MSESCRLCGSEAQFFYEDTQKYFRCPKCKSVFVAKADLPNQESEIERYELHTTEIDEGYKKFVSPITKSIVNDFSKDAKGLDFGCGRSRVIATVLNEKHYKIENYDPFFANNPELLKAKYNYISSCEVIEHFYEPHKEFSLLRSLLTQDAKLYLMTDIYDDSIDFASWYYKNDPTHVFFYTKESLEWIAKEFGINITKCDQRLIIFSN